MLRRCDDKGVVMAGGWDEEVDVLVIGSGAGGMTAAIAAAEAHAQVLIVEKSDEYGGTSATSGGGIWIPNSPVGKAAGLEDSEEDAFAYLRPQSARNVPDELIHAYIRGAPKMLAWLHEKTPVRYMAVPYPDYHVENPGGKMGLRTHLPQPFDGRQLGDDILKLRGPSPAASLFGIINWRFDETYTLLLRPKGWKRTLARMFWRYLSDVPHRFRSIKDRSLTLGNALIGGLRLALKQRNVPIRLETGLIELVREGNRRRRLSDEYRLIIGPDVLEHLEVLDPDSYDDARSELRDARSAKRDQASPKNGVQSAANSPVAKDDQASPGVTYKDGDQASNSTRSGVTLDVPPPTKNTSPKRSTSPADERNLRTAVTGPRASQSEPAPVVELFAGVTGEAPYRPPPPAFGRRRDFVTENLDGAAARVAARRAAHQARLAAEQEIS